MEEKDVLRLPVEDGRAVCVEPVFMLLDALGSSDVEV